MTRVSIYQFIADIIKEKLSVQIVYKLGLNKDQSILNPLSFSSTL